MENKEIDYSKAAEQLLKEGMDTKTKILNQIKELVNKNNSGVIFNGSFIQLYTHSRFLSDLIEYLDHLLINSGEIYDYEIKDDTDEENKSVTFITFTGIFNPEPTTIQLYYGKKLDFSYKMCYIYIER